MKKFLATLGCFYFLTGAFAPLSTLCAGQSSERRWQKKDVLTNARVIQLVKKGIAEEAIIEKIRRSEHRFDISVKGLRSLRFAGVSEAVISEIVHIQGNASSLAQNSAGEAPRPCAPFPIAMASTNDNESMFDSLPPSRTYPFIEVDESNTYRLPQLSDLPAAGPQQPQTKQLRIGAIRPLTMPLNPLTFGKCFDLSEAGYDRIMAIISEGARQVRVHFAEVALPPEAKLFVYSMKNPSEIYGPYEGKGPSGDGAFWTPPVEGEAAVIEFYVPPSASGQEKGHAAFKVTKISHVHRR